MVAVSRSGYKRVSERRARVGRRRGDEAAPPRAGIALAATRDGGAMGPAPVLLRPAERHRSALSWPPTRLHPTTVLAVALLHGAVLTAWLSLPRTTPLGQQPPLATVVTLAFQPSPEPSDAVPAPPPPVQPSAPPIATAPEPAPAVSPAVTPPAPENPPNEAATTPELPSPATQSVPEATVRPAPRLPAKPPHPRELHTTQAPRRVPPAPAAAAGHPSPDAAAPTPASAARPTSAPPTSAPTPAVVSAAWQSLLGAWLEQHKTYPERARERGEQGNVLLRFTIARDGRVSDAAVAHGSGSPMLDASALTMLRNAQVPPFPAAMPQAEVTVSTTIRYQLEP